MRSLLSSLFIRARDLGILDEVTQEDASLVLTSGAKKLTIEEVMSSEGASYLLWSSAVPERLYEVIGVKSDVAAARLVLQYFMGLCSGRFQGRTYSNALLVPKEVTEEGLVLSAADGSQYVILSGDAGGNNANISLGFFDVVYDSNGEHWVMSLPQLFPRDKVKVGVKSSVDPVHFSLLPESLERLTFCPRHDMAPVIGTCIQNGVVVTSSDAAKLVDLNKTVHTFLSGTDTSGYSVPVVVSEAGHHNVSKEILKSDSFRIKALDNGTLQINCRRQAGDRALYSSFTAVANMFKAETYLNQAGVTVRELKSGVDLSGVSEARKLKEFLVSSSKLAVLDTPEIKRNILSRCLSGDEAKIRLSQLGFDTSINVLTSVRQLAVDTELPVIA